MLRWLHKHNPISWEMHECYWVLREGLMTFRSSYLFPGLVFWVVDVMEVEVWHFSERVPVRISMLTWLWHRATAIACGLGTWTSILDADLSWSVSHTSAFVDEVRTLGFWWDRGLPFAVWGMVPCYGKSFRIGMRSMMLRDAVVLYAGDEEKMYGR